ncbi:MAG: hypothetical protein JSW29_06535 [Candidatus Bathyarchaeota archaeon]|nr:MAG: hypothetical protein JSW29_06535 [Candidatus Bathyarchaeota archaeon]
MSSVVQIKPTNGNMIVANLFARKKAFSTKTQSISMYLSPMTLTFGISFVSQTASADSKLLFAFVAACVTYSISFPGSIASPSG